MFTSLRNEDISSRRMRRKLQAKAEIHVPGSNGGIIDSESRASGKIGFTKTKMLSYNPINVGSIQYAPK